MIPARAGGGGKPDNAAEGGRTSILLAELLGTFGLLVAATGSIVYDAGTGYALGLPFVAAMHFAGLFAVVLLFGRYSMAHFNPAVTVGFALSGHVRWGAVPSYLAAQSAGAILGSLFVWHVLGGHADLGLNYPDLSYGIPVIFGTEVAATVFLMGGILLVLAARGVPAYAVAAAVGGIVALDVLFLAPVSGASMNPIRSLSPAILTGMYGDIWLYVSAPLAGAAAPAVAYRAVASRRRPK